MKNLIKLGVCLSLVLMPTSCAELMKQMNKDKSIEVKSMTEDEKFLVENKAKDGVKTTPSGLQFKVITEGIGKKPRSWDTVKVHYRGTLVNGYEFDSSYKRNEPISFPLNQVIAGWTEGLQLMSVGSKYMLYIPSDLAYGSRQVGTDIPPNSTLIFEVELLDVK